LEGGFDFLYFSGTMVEIGMRRRKDRSEIGKKKKGRKRREEKKERKIKEERGKEKERKRRGVKNQ
jgi:hypothetical protein